MTQFDFKMLYERISKLQGTKNQDDAKRSSPIWYWKPKDWDKWIIHTYNEIGYKYTLELVSYALLSLPDQSLILSIRVLKKFSTEEEEKNDDEDVSEADEEEELEEGVE